MSDYPHMRNFTRPAKLNGYMKLGDSTYYDESGNLVEPLTPEGWVKADHLQWNIPQELLESWVTRLPKDKVYRVLIQEVDA